jgi:hypothetical protein
MSPHSFPLTEERLQRIIDLALLLDHIIQKLLLLNVLIRRHQRAAAVVLVHFPVAENVRARE